jgi:hypothetical protein
MKQMQIRMNLFTSTLVRYPRGNRSGAMLLSNKLNYGRRLRGYNGCTGGLVLQVRKRRGTVKVAKKTSRVALRFTPPTPAVSAGREHRRKLRSG